VRIACEQVTILENWSHSRGIGDHSGPATAPDGTIARPLPEFSSASWLQMQLRSTATDCVISTVSGLACTDEQLATEARPLATSMSIRVGTRAGLLSAARSSRPSGPGVKATFVRRRWHNGDDLQSATGTLRRGGSRRSAGLHYPLRMFSLLPSPAADGSRAWPCCHVGFERSGILSGFNRSPATTLFTKGRRER